MYSYKEIQERNFLLRVIFFLGCCNVLVHLQPFKSTEGDDERKKDRLKEKNNKIKMG